MEEIKQDKLRVENNNMCAKCGGLCCKKSGCGYIVQDFESFRFDDLKRKLDEGNISIKACLKVDYVGGKRTQKMVLVLKARSVDKGVVDLISASSQCKMWTPQGCSYSLADRPSLGAGLIPDINNECHENKYSYDEVVADWEKHQAGLEKLVKIYTGKKPAQVYHEQFIETMAPILAKRMLGITNFTLGEEELVEQIPFLRETFPYLMEDATRLALDHIKKAAEKNGLGAEKKPLNVLSTQPKNKR